MWYLAYKILKYDNHVTNLYARKFDYEILNIANEITEIPRIAKKIVSYQHKHVFCSLKCFTIFGGPATNKFLVNWFFIKNCISQNAPRSYK